MLKIKPSESMRKLKPLTPFYSGFSERIRTNYGNINVRMEKEELIHLVSEPPEVFLEDFGMTTLTNNTNIHSTKNIKVEMLNEMINRLYYSDSHHFTYQDKVYVENVLRQLGIENTTNFIRQFQEIKEQMDETINYIRINENNPIAFQKMMERIIVENKRIPKKRKNSKKEVLESRKEKELYEKIFDRLHSNEIYKEVTQLLRANPDMPAVIRQAEFHLAEQKHESRELTLNSIFHTFEGDTRNYLVHRWEQINSGDEIENVTENGDILSSVNASIIMNLIENVMSLRAGDKYIRDEQWYQLSNAYNQSAENTLNRFFNDRSLKTFHIIEENDYSRLIQENVTREASELVYNPEYVENLQQEALTEINIRNQQKLEEIRALEQEIVLKNQVTNPVPDRKNIYNTSQILLEHPELTQEVISNIPANNIQNDVYEQIRNVIVNQVADPFTRELFVQLAENGRPGDISEIESISRQQERIRQLRENQRQIEQTTIESEVQRQDNELVHRTEEHLTNENVVDTLRQQRNYNVNNLIELSENINEINRENRNVINQRTKDVQEENRLLEMVHRTEEQTLSEDVLEELRQQRNYNVNNLTELTENVNEISRENRNVTNQRTRDVQEENRQLEMIHRSDEQTLSEDVLEELRQQRNYNVNNLTELTENVNEISRENRNVTNQRTRDVQEENRQLEMIHRSDEQTLSEDVVEKLRQERHYTEDNLTELSESVHKINRKNRKISNQVAKNVQVEHKQLELVHKSEEQTISEDVLEELRKQRNYIENRLVEVTQNVNTVETNRTEVVNEFNSNEMVRNIQNNVMEMVHDNIKGQVDSISNQVFRRLEKKLDTERKRRGY